MKQNYNLRPLWDAILEVYKAFAEVCDRHGLRYYATGGTALGAMRHGGFIPWDDDFDLVMPRPDYIKFMETYHKELPSQYEAIDYRHDSHYPHGFGKVREQRGNVVNEVSKASNLSLVQGIYIDIIPIDGMPKAEIPFKLWILGRMAWRRTRDLSKEPLLLRPFWWAVQKYLKVPTNNEDYRLAFEKWLCKWDYDKSPVVDDYNTNHRRLKHRILTVDSFGKPRFVPFDKIEIPVPNQVELFLEEIYGNWKELPPEGKRNPSHQLKSL